MWHLLEFFELIFHAIYGCFKNIDEKDSVWFNVLKIVAGIFLIGVALVGIFAIAISFLENPT